MVLIVTAFQLTLPSSAPASPYITPERRRDRTGTHSPPCLSLAALRHASSGKHSLIGAVHPSPCDVGEHGYPARLTQSRASQRLTPAGGYWTIRHGLLCTVTVCFSPSYRVTPTADLCVLLLLAASNHGPVVWFIHTASVISVKCSA